MNKKPTVTIGIPAYKCGENIKKLLISLLKQRDRSYFLKEIMVYIDAPGDDTPEIVTSYANKHKRVLAFNMKKRRGMAYGFKYMLNKFKSDIFVLLNDDILIMDRKFIEKLIKPFNIANVGLVSGNPQPLKARNFIQKSITSTFRAFERTRYSFDDGNNGMTCDGKALAVSRDFIDNLKFPGDLSFAGNVDSFLFFSCMESGFAYRHVRNAIVFFELPDNLKDYLCWTRRNNSNKYVMYEYFGSQTRHKYNMPRNNHLKSMLIEAMKNPFGSLFIYLVGIYAKLEAKGYSKKFPSTWEVITSTKKQLMKI